MRSQWQTHKDHPFLLCDFAGLDGDALQTEIKESDALIMAQPLNSVLVLADLCGIALSGNSLSLFIDTIPRGQKFVRKTAVLGVSGHKKMLFDAVLHITKADNMMIFDDLEKAKDWLVSGN